MPRHTRQPYWLLSPYGDPVWKVCDSEDLDRTATINFGVVLANGRNLTEVAGLYATVKEYAFWVRHPSFNGVDDAWMHASYARALCMFAHGMSVLGLFSFAHLTPHDMEVLAHRSVYGIESLLQAPERLAAFAAEERRSQTLGPLPEDFNDARGRRYREKVLGVCSIPTKPIRPATFRRAFFQETLPPGVGDKQELTAQAIFRLVRPVESLYEMSQVLEAETIPFRPFADGAWGFAERFGRPTKPTPVPPPELLFPFVAQALRMVTDDCVNPVVDVLIADAPNDASGTVLELVTASGPVFVAQEAALRLIAAAAFVLVAAFTAARADAIMQLRAGCLQGNDADGWFLVIRIDKTLKREARLPVPHAVARALQGLERLSQRARQDGDERLFRWLPPSGTVGQKPVRLDPRRLLDDLFTLSVPEGGDLAEWHWTPHQFRRFFAVLYFYRFDGGSVEAISHFLGHFSLDMTRHYLMLDTDVANIFRAEELAYRRRVFRGIASGEREVGGGMGLRLKKLARRLAGFFRRDLRVVSPERVGAVLEAFADRKGLVLSPRPWGPCSCPVTQEASSRARCRILSGTSASVEARGPDFAYASPDVCSSCFWGVVEKQKASLVEREIAHLEVVCRSEPRAGTMLGTLEKARLLALRRFGNW